jgi:hypothetical protein|tara:strand:- start:5044 stop:5490 length:447 start_codon:yes stop_codon:yes gene_type:complete
MTNIIDKIYDNTKDGVPNYSFDLIDGTRLYYRGVNMNPMPVSGDAINFTVINTKTSANGNQYTNIKDVEVIKNPDGQNDAPQQLGNVVNKANIVPPGNGINKNETQRLDIFVTGVVGRSMGSGHFSVNDIGELTKNAVNAFNENLKKL